VSFAVVVLVLMLSIRLGAYEDMVNGVVGLNTGHLQIQAPGYFDDEEIRKTVADPGPVIDRLRTIHHVTGVSSRSRAYAMASGAGRTIGVLVVGVDPKNEPHVSTLPEGIKKGRYFSGSDRGKAVIGSLLAEGLNVGIGDELALIGHGKDDSIAATVVSLVGVFHTGVNAIDRSMVQIPLHDFDEVFFMEGAVHKVVVFVAGMTAISKVRETLQPLLDKQKLIVMDWSELMPGLKQGIQIDLTFFLLLNCVLIVIVAFSILNTFLMAIFERTQEFGVLMAIGTRPGRLMKVMLMESFIIALLGVLGGMILGSALTVYLSHVGIALQRAEELLATFGVPARLYPRLSWVSMLTGPVVIMIVSNAAAFLPALKIRKLKPVEAMRAA
jgi:ABC-type lipoprotein release transport system permease subunit